MKRQKLSQDVVVPVSVSSNETTKDSSSSQQTFTVPRLARNSKTGLVDAPEFFKLYDTYQLVHIISREEDEKDEKDEEEERFGAYYVAELFQNMNPMDKNSWNWENAPEPPQQDMEPISFLAVDEIPSSNHMNISRRRGYASFLVQHDPEQQDALLHRLPITELPLTHQTPKRPFTFGSCIWFFFGRNDDDEVSTKQQEGGGHLPGRPRHTDAVGHDGTFHYQLSGSKIWFLQPTEELCNKSLSEDDHPMDPQMTLEVICNKGDVLVINTRLWWHSTVLPVQPRMDKKKKNSDQESVPSISYARDFYLGIGLDTTADEEKDISQVGLEQQQPMSNVDGS